MPVLEPKTTTYSSMGEEEEFLLYTKLWVPSHLQNYVQRPDLLQRLKQGQQGKCTLVCAPAGFGKTSLIIEWFQQAKLPVAWLSLDEEDNDPRRFWRYLIAALQTVFPKLGESVLVHLQSSPVVQYQHLSTLLLNELQTVTEEFFLVLDDYQFITHFSLQETMGLLLSRIPPTMHVAITSRSFPDFPLGRMRVRGELTEILANDLRFSQQNIQDYFSQLSIDLDKKQLALLEKKTEGWAAGLHLAGLSLQRSEKRENLLQEFSGSHRYIADFLGEEVLQQQSPMLQQFLLKTSILQRFSPDLCDHILAYSESEGLLDELQRQQLFIIPLDHRQNWYRYHHLFQDLLQSQLNARLTPQEITELHQSASQWLIQHGWIDEGIQHLLKAEDYERAASVLLDLAEESFQRGIQGEFATWLRHLPENVLNRYPILTMYLLNKMFTDGDSDGLHRIVPGMILLWESRQEAMKDYHRQDSSIEGFLALCRSLQARYQRIPDEVIHYAEIAYAKLSGNHQFFAHQALLLKAVGNLPLSQSMEDFETNFEVLYEQSLQTRDIFFMKMSTWSHAYVASSMGHLRRAEELNLRYLKDLSYLLGENYNRSLELGIHQSLADIYFAQNKLEEAEQSAERSLKLGQQKKHLRILMKVSLTFAKIRQYQDRVDDVKDFIAKAKELLRRYDRLPNQLRWHVAHLKQLELWLGHTDSLDQWFGQKQIGQSKTINMLNQTGLLLKARLHLTKKRYKEADEMLQRLLDSSADASKGWLSPRVEALLLQSMSHLRQQNQNLALPFLKEALDIAEPETLLYPFVGEKEGMLELLPLLLSSEHELDNATMVFAQKIISILTPHVSHKPIERSHLPHSNDSNTLPATTTTMEVVAPSKSSDPYFLDPLSKRETEIIQLVAEGYTNKELAKQLFLAHSTVKKHMSNIYSKLNVSNRTKAMVRARELGLLE